MESKIKLVPMILLIFSVGLVLLIFKSQNTLNSTVIKLGPKELPKYFNFGIVKSPETISIQKIEGLKKQYLIFENPHINEIKILNSNNEDINITGDIFDFNQRKINFRNFVFEINEKHEGDSILVELAKTGENLSFNVLLLSENDWGKYLKLDNQETGFILGLALLSLIFILTTFSFKGSKKNVFFILYFIFALLWILNDRGFMFQNLWPENPYFHSISRGLFSSSSILLFGLYLFQDRSKETNLELIKCVKIIISFIIFKLLLTIIVYFEFLNIHWKERILLANSLIVSTLFFTLICLLIVKIINDKILNFETLSILIYLTFVLGLSLSELGIFVMELSSYYDQTVLLFLVLQILFMGIHQRKTEINSKKIREQEFNEKIHSIENQEKQRIARNIHDDLGGIFAAIKYQLFTLRKNKINLNEINKIDNLIKLTNEGVKNQTKIIESLIEELNTEITMEELLLKQASMIFKNKKIEVDISISEIENRISHLQKTEIYRIILELMTNTFKHSGANRISIYSRINQEIEIHYKDNGKGFNENLKNKGNGLSNIQFRAERIKANLSFQKTVNFYLIIKMKIHDQ